MNKRKHFLPPLCHYLKPPRAAIFGLKGQEIGSRRHTAACFRPVGTCEGWRERDRGSVSEVHKDMPVVPQTGNGDLGVCRAC